jgi:hypothetical protein
MHQHNILAYLLAGHEPMTSLQTQSKRRGNLNTICHHVVSKCWRFTRTLEDSRHRYALGVVCYIYTEVYTHFIKVGHVHAYTSTPNFVGIWFCFGGGMLCQLHSFVSCELPSM